MEKIITIAVDAMGGDNSPQKIIDGIELYNRNNKNIFYKIFGDKNIIDPIIQKKNIDNDIFEIFHTEEKIKTKIALLLQQNVEKIQACGLQ